MVCMAAKAIPRNYARGSSILLIGLASGAICSLATASWASSAADARTWFVDADGVRYAYRAFGAPSEPLVFLQRFRDSLDDWDPVFVDAVASERRVSLFNDAGVASSGGDAPETIEDMAGHAARVIRALGAR